MAAIVKYRPKPHLQINLRFVDEYEALKCQDHYCLILRKFILFSVVCNCF